MDKKKIIIIALSVLIVTLCTVATYAYFSATINGNSNGKNIKVDMSKMKLEFSDKTGKVVADSINPGWTYQKKVSVTNTGTVPVKYDLVWLSLQNEIEQDELVYSITCDNCNGIDESPVPSYGRENLKIVTNTIEKDEIQEYTINFTFKEINDLQDYNQNKEFKGNIGIKENNTYEESPIGLLSDTDWEYTIDDENNKVMLTYYKGTNPNVEIYPAYIKDNKKYKTIIKEGNIISGKTTSIFVKNANLYNNTNGIVENVEFMGNVEFENNSMQYLFEKCTSLKKIDISKIDFSNISNATRWLCDCSLIINQDQIKGFNNLAKLTNMTELFRSSYLQSLNLESWDISKVTNASYMFAYCYKLTNLDLSSFDTSNVTNMNYIIAYCSGLTNLILSNFNTSKVTNMDHMFLNCSSLKNLDVKSFNTKNVVCMCSLFEGCSLLTNLDLTNFNTSKVTDMRAMFSRCTSLKNLNLSSFDTSNVTIIYYIFDQCNSLENLDLSNFNTSKVQRFSAGKTIFSNMTSLKELHINNFSFDSINNESYGYLFSGSTPTDVHIYTNEAAKQYINEKHPTYTNITVV